MNRSVAPRQNYPDRRSRLKLSRLLSCGAIAAGLWSSPARAVNYYWDSNGTTTGTDPTPNGTLGTSAFLNTSSTGGSGTFSTTPTAADTVFFSALSSSTDTTSAGMAYTVGVNGTQTVSGLVFYSAGALTLGDSTTTLSIGSGGLTYDRYLDGAGGGSTTGVVTINSNLSLTADQTWSGSNIPNPGFIINGSTTGTGNLILNELVNRAMTINGGINMTGSLSFKGGNAQGASVVVAGAIGSNVTGLTEQLASNSPLDSVTLSSTTGNSYGGTTTLSAGTLFLNSGSTTSTVSLTGAGAVNVAGNTAILAGTNGVSSGLLTVTSNGIIAPGAKASTAPYQNTGTLHLGTTGGVTLTQASLDFDLATTAAGIGDKIILGTGTTATGALTLGTVTFNFEAAASATGSVLQTGTPYTLVTAGSSFTLPTNISTNFLGGLSGNGYTATYSEDAGNDLQVTFAVPEPSTWMGASFFLVAVGWSQRKRVGARRDSALS